MASKTRYFCKVINCALCTSDMMTKIFSTCVTTSEVVTMDSHDLLKKISVESYLQTNC